MCNFIHFSHLPFACVHSTQKQGSPFPPSFSRPRPPQDTHSPVLLVKFLLPGVCVCSGWQVRRFELGARWGTDDYIDDDGGVDGGDPQSSSSRPRPRPQQRPRRRPWPCWVLQPPFSFKGPRPRLFRHFHFSPTSGCGDWAGVPGDGLGTAAAEEGDDEGGGVDEACSPAAAAARAEARAASKRRAAAFADQQIDETQFILAFRDILV